MPANVNSGWVCRWAGAWPDIVKSWAAMVSGQSVLSLYLYFARCGQYNMAAQLMGVKIYEYIA